MGAKIVYLQFNGYKRNALGKSLRHSGNGKTIKDREINLTYLNR